CKENSHVFSSFSKKKKKKRGNKEKKLDVPNKKKTLGQEEFDRIRPLSYRDAHFFLVCFAIDNEDSFEHVSEKWVVLINCIFFFFFFCVVDIFIYYKKKKGGQAQYQKKKKTFDNTTIYFKK
ncbi:hypothetical protein RFI_24738, partial [Reticulomyxa filosa]